MNVASRWTCVVLALAGCGNPTEPPAPPPPAQTPAPATSREILVDLVRWDAATTAGRRAAAEDVARRLPDFALLRLETFSCGGQTHEVAIYKHAKAEMEFVLVPGGTFEMRFPFEKSNTPDGGRQVVRVLPFLMARTEVTVDKWNRMTGERRTSEWGGQVPVVGVTWSASRKACEDVGCSLPTEAEWECACRAGTTSQFFWGETFNEADRYGWFDWGALHPVALKCPNAFGVFDMPGNAQEWCLDVFASDYGESGALDPTGPTVTTGRRVVRGGFAIPDSYVFASGFRDSAPETIADRFLGFRPAKTVPMD